MRYYYLNETDIIQQGDEFKVGDEDISWTYCRSSVGKTIYEGLQRFVSEQVVVRRKINKTKLGNLI